MNLDFKNSHTTYSTHGFHTYPAKMIPQVAKALLDEYGKGIESLYDPYCGSGTSLVEAKLHNINAIGSDLNPLARLIAKVKTTPIELQTLDLHLQDFYNYLFNYRFGFRTNENSIIVPTFKNIDFWFSRTVKKDLSIISCFVDNIENVDIKEFFQVALSQTIRECSWTRKNEFKLYKMSANRIRIFKPDTFSTFEKILGKNRNGLKSLMKEADNDVNISINSFNSSNYISRRIIPDESIDMVLTSPPYGDSSTTVAYGQFSALANQWLGFMERGRGLDNELMGGKKAGRIQNFNSLLLNDQIREIERADRSRALDVVSFYRDYYSSIRNVSTKVRPGGYACYVVSNRTVRGVQLGTGEITKDFFEAHGFGHVETLSRNISNKRMPKKNSASGVKGKKTPLMNKELIVVMQKQGR
ncbi:site-specific DNA-methyltransferase [Flavobacteriaceae bacterium GF1]